MRLPFPQGSDNTVTSMKELRVNTPPSRLEPPWSSFHLSVRLDSPIELGVSRSRRLGRCYRNPYRNYVTTDRRNNMRKCSALFSRSPCHPQWFITLPAFIRCLDRLLYTFLAEPLLQIQMRMLYRDGLE